MARVFALADLHLSLRGDKPMDVFGELWRDHPRRMAEAWDRDVRAEDTVLLPGDLSWARNLAEAEPDLAWIAERPGRKLFLRGNHDGWWASVSKVRGVLPPGSRALQNDSHEVEGWVVVGARGWIAPDDPYASAHDGAVFRRELDRLRQSIAHADRTHGREAPRMAMTHFPPWLEGRPPTAVVPLLVAAGVRVCVYGHLHGEDHRLAVEGQREGIRFVFAAADAVGFAPRPLDLEAARDTAPTGAGP